MNTAKYKHPARADYLKAFSRKWQAVATAIRTAGRLGSPEELRARAVKLPIP